MVPFVLNYKVFIFFLKAVFLFGYSHDVILFSVEEMSSPHSVVPKKSAVKTRSVAGRQGRALMIKSEELSADSAGMSYRTMYNVEYILIKYMYMHVCVLVVSNTLFYLMPSFKLYYKVFLSLRL